jgi:hypothetical protein
MNKKIIYLKLIFSSIKDVELLKKYEKKSIKLSRYINIFRENASFQNLIYFNNIATKDPHININQKVVKTI